MTIPDLRRLGFQMVRAVQCDRNRCRRELGTIWRVCEVIAIESLESTMPLSHVVQRWADRGEDLSSISAQRLPKAIACVHLADPSGHQLAGEVLRKRWPFDLDVPFSQFTPDQRAAWHLFSVAEMNAKSTAESVAFHCAECGTVANPPTFAALVRAAKSRTTAPILVR